MKTKSEDVLTYSLLAIIAAIGAYILFFRKKADPYRLLNFEEPRSENGTVTIPIDTSWPISQGSRGENVKRLQRALISKGFSLPRFGPDGIWGTETSNAIRAAGLRSTVTLADVMELEKPIVLINSSSARDVVPTSFINGVKVCA